LLPSYTLSPVPVESRRDKKKEKRYIDAKTL
jgi:hypothetical protein